ncbi:hypothetical protein V6N11_008731 [Hibiscus sabdariffa]|uniref:Uncharacterized protein n=1 Tax=Hibiscus sabdariffa TaxID=183260 RepID=A0ABR2NR22_9ROSI
MKSVVCERGKRPNSNSRPKMKHNKKKKTKIDAKMPKIPPSAFFYFFCSSLCFLLFISDSSILEHFRFGFELKSICLHIGRTFVRDFKSRIRISSKSMRDIGKACGEKSKT